MNAGAGTGETRMADDAGVLARPLFATPITRLFGIRHPLLCGGLMWLATCAIAWPAVKSLSSPVARVLSW